MTKTYHLYYDDTPLVDVLIDDQPQTLQYITEMVEFWMGWEGRLKESRGDYVQCWLKNLAVHVLDIGELPKKDDEGWSSLDGTQGITVTWFRRPEIDRDLIGVEEIS